MRDIPGFSQMPLHLLIKSVDNVVPDHLAIRKPEGTLNRAVEHLIIDPKGKRGNPVFVRPLSFGEWKL